MALSDKSWAVVASKEPEKHEKKARYYFETDEIVGTVTDVSLCEFDITLLIQLDNSLNSVTVSIDQDQKLKSVCKDDRISAVVRFKRRMNDEKLINGQLLSFDIFSQKTLA